MAAPKLSFRPVTKARKADFEELFASKGAPSYCWCMAWRASTEELKDANSAARKRQMLQRIERGTPVGLVGYLDGAAIAWVSIAPRETFRGLGGPEAEPAENIWSLTCMFVRREHRGEGLGRQLISGAVAYAKKRGATTVEAYPVEPTSPSYRHMGFIPAFDAAGFKPVGRAGTRRHVMRLSA